MIGNQTKKRRGASKKYYHVETHETKELALISINESHSDYVYLKTHGKGNIGKKIFYRCKHTIVRGKQCSTGLYLYLPSDSTKYEIYKTNCKKLKLF